MSWPISKKSVSQIFRSTSTSRSEDFEQKLKSTWGYFESTRIQKGRIQWLFFKSFQMVKDAKRGVTVSFAWESINTILHLLKKNFSHIIQRESFSCACFSESFNQSFQSASTKKKEQKLLHSANRKRTTKSLHLFYLCALYFYICTWRSFVYHLVNSKGFIHPLIG